METLETILLLSIGIVVAIFASTAAFIAWAMRQMMKRQDKFMDDFNDHD